MSWFPSLFQWMLRGRKVEDRGRGSHPSFVSPRPVSTLNRSHDEVIAEMKRIIDAKYGLTDCPECAQRVAVLIHGLCRDCGPEDAA